MKQGLQKLSVLVFGLWLNACVTEDTYSGTLHPLIKSDIDEVAAARARVQLGLSYLQKGDAEQAKYNLDKAVEFAPQLEAVHLGLAHFYQHVGEVKLARSSYRRAINAQDASGDSLNNFGVFLCQQGDFTGAEALILRAVKTPKYTRTAASYENLGVCSRKASQIEKARNYFAMALKYDPRRKTSRLELTELAIEQTDFVLASAQLAQYHRVALISPESLALGIAIARGLDDGPGVKKFGIQLLARFPSSFQAKQYRAGLD